LGTRLARGRGAAGGSHRQLRGEYCDAYYDLKAVDRAGVTIARADRLYFDCGKREIVTLL
jgi:hypothetical protein